jgi:hypothetical protein
VKGSSLGMVVFVPRPGQGRGPKPLTTAASLRGSVNGNDGNGMFGNGMGKKTLAERWGQKNLVNREWS